MTLNVTFDSLLNGCTVTMLSLMTCIIEIHDGTRPGRFYLLAKVHNKGVPGRPVISACGSATEGLSEIADYFLQPYFSTIPSFIKDTDDFIRKIRDINVIPHGAFLLVSTLLPFTQVSLILMVFVLLEIFFVSTSFQPR